MWNSAMQCGSLQGIQDTSKFFPHQLLEKFPHQCGKFAENSDLVFFTMRKNAEIINLNKFCSGKYRRKISSAEILDLDNFTSGKYLRKLISPDHK